MNEIPFSRRSFLGTTSLAFLGLRDLASAEEIGIAAGESVFQPHGPLVKDPAGILDLPKGFEYRVISRAGEKMIDGYRVPGVPDGMAAFPGEDGMVILVCNHEMSTGPSRLGPWDRADQNGAVPEALRSLAYDPGAGGEDPYLGGTTNLVFDPTSGTLVHQFLSLTGTDRNCAGGPMPWGTWITCEEPANLTDARGSKHGWCFEVKATAEPDLQQAVPLRALGRFRHEAVALDPVTGILYITEDRNDGVLYRCIPEHSGDFQTGRLQALVVVDHPGADLRNYLADSTWPEIGAPLVAKWIDLTDTDSPKDDLRIRAYRDGAARFARSEGIHHSPDGIYLCCTDGGPERRGQIFRLRPGTSEDSSDELELFLQPKSTDLLNNGDNLCPSPWGDLIVCEDLIDPKFASHTHLRAVTPDGRIHSIARNSKDNSEFAGCCFSPDGTWLFTNLQSAGLTLAITGPWQPAKS